MRPGTVKGITALIADISDKHKVDRENEKILAKLSENQDLLSNIINSDPTTIFAYDLNHRLTMVNDTAAFALGASKDQILGKKLHDFWPKKVADHLMEISDQVASTGLPITTEETVTWKGDQSTRHTRVTKFPILNSKQEVTGIAGVAIDLTDIKAAHKQFEKALEETKTLQKALQDMFDTIPVALATIDSTYHFTRFNPAMATLVGYSPEELRQMTSLELTHPEDVDRYEKAIKRVASESPNVPIRYEKRYIHKSGRAIWVRVTARALNASSENLGAITGTIEDITLEKITQEALAVKAAEMQKLINGVPAQISHWDNKLKNLAANSAYTQMFGKAPAQIRGMSCREVIGPLFKTVKPYLEKALKGEELTVDIEQTLPDGKTTYSRTIFKPDIENKRVIGVYTISIDVTAQKNYEAERDRVANFLDIVLHNVSSMIFVKDFKNDLCFSLLNKSGENLLGLKEIDLLGKTDYDIFPKEQADFFRKNDKLVFADKSIVKIDKEEIQTVHGKRYLQTYKVPTFDQNGEPNLLIGISNDITTEIKSIEEKDRTSEKFRSIFGISPSPILVFGHRGILDCNPAALQILCASSKSDLLGKHPAVFSPRLQPDGRTSEEKSIEMDSLARKKGAHRFEWIHRKMDGREFPVDVTLSPITWDGHDALLVLWSDLTEKKKQDLKILQTSKLASLGQLSAGIAHEINNPLAIIDGTAHLLTNFRDNPEQFISKIAVIEKACGRISKIVGGLKKFSRTGEMLVHERRVLSEIVKEVEILTEMKCRRHATRLTIECNTQATILCDEVEIEQVIVNLVSNAIDANKTKPERWVKVSVYEESPSIILRVTDSGPGLSPDVRKNLFEPFFTTKKGGEGTGLGLSISKSILEEHNATITVLEDVPNTCFEIRFQKV